MSKFIFVTGGVCSSLGKGVAAASIGSLLECSGLKIAMMKCDPYINVDAGTMNPYQHGEVYVTADGAETDLNLGNYARFVNVKEERCPAVVRYRQDHICVGIIRDIIAKNLSADMAIRFKEIDLFVAKNILHHSVIGYDLTLGTFRGLVQQLNQFLHGRRVFNRHI